MCETNYCGCQPIYVQCIVSLTTVTCEPIYPNVIGHNQQDVPGTFFCIMNLNAKKTYHNGKEVKQWFFNGILIIVSSLKAEHINH